MRLFVVLPSLLSVCSVACVTPEFTPLGPNVEIVEEVMNPIDATPSADAFEIFVVTDSDAVSELLVLRSGDVMTLTSFEHARAVAADSTYVYVADVGVDAVFHFDIATATRSMMEGTDGLGARALHIGGDNLYIAGDGALYSIYRHGAPTPTMLATGFPGFIDGVTRTDDGTLYVTGEAVGGAGAEEGAVFEIVDGAPVVLADGIHIGTPAGVAITPDDATVMVSSLSDEGTSQVVLVSRADGSTSIFDDVINENTDSGGLHRAADVPNVYAWVDAPSGGPGGIHRVTF